MVLPHFNAVDALPGGGRIRIQTSRYLGADGRPRVAVVVSDSGSGSGMNDETRRRCLDPFFTTKGQRGAGLGLAIVYCTVTRHGGGKAAAGPTAVA